MNEYLKKLIFRYLHIHSLNHQVRLIQEWESPSRLQALDIGSHFFGLVIFSFSRTILLELCKLVSNREDKSLIDWLNKAKENAKALEPSRHNSHSEGHQSRIPLTLDEYTKLIDEHLDQIFKHDKTIQRLKGRRDKIIAHSDKSFFNDPQKLIEKYHLNNPDISALMDTISEILREHHVLLLHADMTPEVASAHDVDIILKYVRAFARVRKDKKVTHDSGILVFKYLQDEYQESIS